MDKPASIMQATDLRYVIPYRYVREIKLAINGLAGFESLLLRLENPLLGLS